MSALFRADSITPLEALQADNERLVKLLGEARDAFQAFIDGADAGFVSVAVDRRARTTLSRLSEKEAKV